MNSRKLNTRGTLFIVATPIGNLRDISFRAVEVLTQVKWIAAEDTRHSAPLLKHYGIETPLKSFHEHNESSRIQWIQNELEEGHDVALISDAGTPLISDPGYTLVTNLAHAGFKISPIPGCCAAIAALSAAGLSTEHFNFQGFLPSKSSQRKNMLNSLQYEIGTLVFYEAPHRLLASLEDFIAVFGGARKAVVARELTKTYESFQRGALQALLAHYQENPDQQRGEIAILLEGAEKVTLSTLEAERILKILLSELPVKKAATLTAEITGLRKNDLYELGLKIK